MRYHYLRFDIWLCLLFSLFVSIFTAHIAQRILAQGYEGYVQKHTAPVPQGPLLLVVALKSILYAAVNQALCNLWVPCQLCRRFA